MGFFSSSKTTQELVVPKPPRPSFGETQAFGGAASTLGLGGQVSEADLSKKERKLLSKLRKPKFGGLLSLLSDSGGGGAASDLDRQRALEQEQLGIQRGFVGPQGDLQRQIIQNLITSLGPEGIEGIGGLVSQAFSRTELEGQRRIDEFFRNAGFEPAGTTPAAQAFGEFQGELSSAKAQAIIDQLRFSLDRGLTASSQQPFVPGFQGQALPSTGLGIGLGQAQTQLGGTLGNIRSATFKPQVLSSSQGPGAGSSFLSSFGSGLGSSLGGGLGNLIV